MTHQDLLTEIRKRNFLHAEFKELLGSLGGKALEMSAEAPAMSEVADHLTDAFITMDDVYVEPISAVEYYDARQA